MRKGSLVWAAAYRRPHGEKVTIQKRNPKERPFSGHKTCHIFSWFAVSGFVGLLLGPFSVLACRAPDSPRARSEPSYTLRPPRWDQFWFNSGYRF